MARWSGEGECSVMGPEEADSTGRRARVSQVVEHLGARRREQGDGPRTSRIRTCERPAGRFLSMSVSPVSAADALPYLGARVLWPGDMMGDRVVRERCSRS